LLPDLTLTKDFVAGKERFAVVLVTSVSSSALFIASLI